MIRASPPPRQSRALMRTQWYTPTANTEKRMLCYIDGSPDSSSESHVLRHWSGRTICSTLARADTEIGASPVVTYIVLSSSAHSSSEQPKVFLSSVGVSTFFTRYISPFFVTTPHTCSPFLVSRQSTSKHAWPTMFVTWYFPGGIVHPFLEEHTPGQHNRRPDLAILRMKSSLL